MEFDSIILGAEAVTFAAGWQSDLPPEISPGRIALSGNAEVACERGTTCLIGLITWRGIEDGSSAVRTSSVLLTTSDGEVQIPASESSVAVVSSAIAIPPDSLGQGGVLMIVVFLSLVSIAVGLPAALYIVRMRRKERRRQVSRPEIQPALTQQLAQAAAGYLDAFELAGDAQEEPDGFFEILARQSGPKET